MKKNLVIFSVITAISCTAFAGDKQFIDFTLKKVHDRQFNGCDQAVLDVFSNVGGNDIRIITDINNELKNQIRVTGVYGNKGDSVYLSTLITKVDNKCVSAKTLIITDNKKSCVASLADAKPFEYKTETADYIFAENPGKVDLLLTPAGDSCVRIYQSTNTYKAN